MLGVGERYRATPQFESCIMSSEFYVVLVCIYSLNVFFGSPMISWHAIELDYTSTVDGKSKLQKGLIHERKVGKQQGQKEEI